MKMSLLEFIISYTGSSLTMAFAGVVTIFSLITIGVVFFSLYRFRIRGRFSPFTEKSLRPPGYSLDVKLDSLRGDLLLYSASPLMISLIIFAVSLELALPAIAVLCIFLIAALFLAFKLRRLFVKIKKYGLGYDGELYTGFELTYLMRYGAWVYHDLPYKYGNIDHVIVASGGVFVVETKTYSKPQKGKGKQRDANVVYEDGILKFPDFHTSKPILQATAQAKAMSGFLFKRTGKRFPVKPVVALPGWFVKSKAKGNEDVIVINPKRGALLKGSVSQARISKADTKQIAEVIEDHARSARYSSDIINPDANENFDLLLNRKEPEPNIDRR